MARTARADVFSPDEIAILHVVCRVVRRCYLFGDDPLTGRNYDHRKSWVVHQLELMGACMGIDVLCYAVLSNHCHLVLRSRPDVVKVWDDREIARRWLTLCPKRKLPDGSAKPPSEAELNAILNNAKKLSQLRSRLSDISWLVRLLCQRIAQRANAEEDEAGKFWRSRFRAVRLLDEAAILACAAYVDLNPIRAAMAETIEGSDFTSAQLRTQALVNATPDNSSCAASGNDCVRSPDRFLSPVQIDELLDPLGARPSSQSERCSDKGFLPMTSAAYLDLLDWTARQIAPGKRGATPNETPAIFERLGISAEVWCELVSGFGRLFSVVAGRPQSVDDHRSLRRRQRSYLKQTTRELLTVQ
ncbi:MAG: hypothetical protein R3C53_25205 [Pirellulaceae bacterium]